MNSQLVESWIAVSLVAMFANVAKVLLVKTRCRTVDSWALLFYARLLPGVVLLLTLLFIDHTIHDAFSFWSATVAAAVITIGASLLYMEAVKEGELSLVTPIQATIPMFMIACTYMLYGEAPGAMALFFIGLIIVSVSFVLRASARTKQEAVGSHRSRAVLYSFIAAALFGISTVIDRIAIAAASNGALVFSAWWNLVTLLLLLPVLFIKRKTVEVGVLFNANVNLYVFAVLIAFVAQQYAVQLSLDLDNGVTYVKTIVMAHIVIASGAGIIYLKEQASRAVLLANLITAVSGVGLLWSI